MPTNFVTLLGRVQNEPELTTARDGQAVLNFRMTTGRYIARTESDVETHNIVVWGEAARESAKRIKKGDVLQIDGRLRYRKRGGEDIAEVVAERGGIQFIEEAI